MSNSGASYLIGLGNYSRGDDAVGLKIAELVVGRGLERGFTALALAGNALNALSYFTEDTARILFVDCALMGLAPGEFRVFAPEDAASRKIMAGISTHESDLLAVLALAAKTGMSLPPVRIMAIQPERLDPGAPLSVSLAARLESYAQAAVKELAGGDRPD